MKHEELLRKLVLISQRYFSILTCDKMTNQTLLEVILANAQDGNENLVNLDRLLELDELDFCHDIQGLYCHTDVLNRFIVKDNYVPRCGYLKNDTKEASFKVECENINNKNKQLFEIKVIQLEGDNECFEGFVKNLKNEIPKHGFYPCTNKKILKEG